MNAWPKYATHSIEAATAAAAGAGILTAARVVEQTTSSAGIPGWVLALALAAPAGAGARLAREARGAVTRYSNWRDDRIEAYASRPTTTDDTAQPAGDTTPPAGGAGTPVDHGSTGGAGPTKEDGYPSDEGRTGDHSQTDRNGRDGSDLSGKDIEDVQRSHGATSTDARDQGPVSGRWRGRFAPATDIAERFWSKVTKPTDPDVDGCWIWTAGLTGDGYGRFRIGTGDRSRLVKAHRWAYDAEVGPIPAGLTIDHTCRNRACVRPEHLEAVTHAENLRRAADARRATPTHRCRDHADYIGGHPPYECVECGRRLDTIDLHDQEHNPQEQDK